MKKYKVSGKNIEELLPKIAKKLKVDIKEIDYSLISEKKILGIVKNREFEVWVKKVSALPVEKKKSVENETKESGVEKSIDEKVTIEILEEGVYITVLDSSVELNDLIDFIAQKDIEAPDMENIMKACETLGEKIKIAEFYEGIYFESEISVEIDDDKLSAYILFSETRGMNMPTVENVKEKLIESGVVYGVEDSLIEAALISGIFDTPILVAEGKIAEDGKDGYIKYHVSVLENKSRLKPTELENGSVDFKNMNLIENVKKGDVLAEVIAAEEGKVGIDVFGEEELSKPGKECYLSSGKNTEFLENGTKLIASIDGMVTIAEKKISVLNVYSIDQVGITSGNIDFSGGVLVRGDVEPGYEIKAEGNIEIKGNVEKANLFSDHDILVRGSVFGKEVGLLKAKEDIVINFGEAVHIESGGDVVINEAVMNSYVSAAKKIKVLDRKGVIIGGSIKAGEGVEAINIGSDSAIKTEIEVGSNPEILEKIKKEEEQKKLLEKKMSQVEKNITLLQKIKSQSEEFPKEKAELLTSLVTAKFSMKKRIRELTIDIESGSNRVKDVKGATVDVHGTCFPGVKIKIRKGTFFVKEEMHNTRFYYEKAEVKFTALK